MRQNKVDFVVRELHYPAGLAETIAQQTGAKLVELPAMSGGMQETKDYISFVDYNVRTMVKAAAAAR
jgi:ABC-type Zn uptake system ZnuABC Zn-binding protein ZnuA